MAEGHRFLTDETGLKGVSVLESIDKTLRAIADGSGAKIEDEIEYGLRRAVGSSNPQGERVTRYKGVISPWEIEFTKNIGKGNVVDNPFDYISIFSPEPWEDSLGNKFARFSRFYYAEQTIGTYRYIWVCRKKLYDFYKLPRAFCKGREPHWDYVDLSCYEGGEEIVPVTGGESLTCLVSKPGKIPSHNRNRTTLQNYAKNIETVLEVNTGEEEYCITPISAVTEIRNILRTIMIGSINSQADGYRGVDTRGFNNDTGRPILSFDKDEDGMTRNTIYIQYTSGDLQSASATNSCFSIGPTTPTDNSNYYGVTSAEQVLGNISDGVFSLSEDGEQYIKITLDRNITQTIEPGATAVYRRPNITGATDEIEATHGTLSNDGYNSFKEFLCENHYANIWENILDCTIYNGVPYICEDLSKWTDTSSLQSNEAFKACNYSLSGANGYVTELGYDSSHPDVRITTAVGGTTSTYYGDYFYINTTGARSLYVGGLLNNGASAGAVCWHCSSGVGVSNWSVGSRLFHRARADSQDN